MQNFYILSRLFVQFFLSHSTKKFRWGTLRCVRKFCASQNFMHKKRISLNSVEISLCHSADKIRRRTLLFRKNSGIEKFQGKEGGSFTVLSKIFLYHRTEKNSPGNHSVFQKISGREKYFMDKRGGVSRFSVEVFVSLYRNISLENTLVFQKNSFIENSHA